MCEREIRDGRQVCTRELPMPAGADGLWLHPDAKHVGECSQGCCDDYECPHCGKGWRNEGAD